MEKKVWAISTIATVFVFPLLLMTLNCTDLFIVIQLSLSLSVWFLKKISQCCDIETLGDHILVVYIFLSQSQALNLVSFNHIHMSVIEPDMMLINILDLASKSQMNECICQIPSSWTYVENRQVLCLMNTFP